MLEFVVIYQWAILAGFLLVIALGLLGCHLAARDKAMQTICVGQGATVGTLIGLGMMEAFGQTESTDSVGPLFFAIAFSIGTYLLSDWIVEKRQASKNTYFSAIFAMLLAMGSLTCILFPHLENHMSHVFFGDLATLTDRQSQWAIALSLLTVGTASMKWRQLTLQSFRQATFGRLSAPLDNFRIQLLFHALTLVLLSFSVQFAGFLFTIAGLFLPTTLAKLSSRKGIRKHFMLCIVIGSVGTVLGFLISLKYTRLPTVPTAIMAMVTTGLLLALPAQIVRKIS